MNFKFLFYNHCSVHNFLILFFIFLLVIHFYLNFTAACQTNANKKKSTGIIGRTSTIGSKGK